MNLQIVLFQFSWSPVPALRVVHYTTLHPLLMVGGGCSMAMSTQIQAQVSKRDTVVLGGNMALRRGMGGGSVTVVLRRQISPISSVELLAMVGLRSILSFQTSR